MKKIIITTNLPIAILSVVSLVSLTVATFSLISQKNLNSIIKMQDTKISELIKYKKDFQFGQVINSDSSLTSIEELKKMVKDLKDNQGPSFSEVLGTLTTDPAIILSDTTPPVTVTP